MAAEIVPTTTTTTLQKCQKQPPPPLTTDGEKRKNKKRRGAFAIIKAAVLIVRHMRTKKQKQVVKENNIMKKLLGTVRPGHFQGNQSPPPNLPTVGSKALEMKNVDDENNNNVMLTPLECPSRTSSSSSSSASVSHYQAMANLHEGLEKGSDVGYVSDHHEEGGGVIDHIGYAFKNSRGELSNTCYASPVSQLGLDLSGDSTDNYDTEDEEGVDENGGDEMIDSKAEEFIAQFYQQIRLQSLQSLE